MKKDYYEILGVPRSSSLEEIKRAYRKLAHQYHPDKKAGNEEKFKEANEAYQVLGNEGKRAQYDQFGQTFDASAEPGGGFGWNDIFSGARGGEGAGDFGFNSRFGEFDLGDIFEGLFGASGAHRDTKRKRGKDIVIDITIPFEESILGGKETIEYKRTVRCARCSGTGGEPGTNIVKCATCGGKGSIQKSTRTILGSMTRVETCPRCRGAGDIPEKFCGFCGGKGLELKKESIELIIPKGTKTDDVLRLSGKGEIADAIGAPGDLFVRLRVLPHKTFKRQGDDLIMAVSIKISQAILGGHMTLEAIDGTVDLKIPEGTQSGDILRLRGRGVSESRGYGRGDLLVEVTVEVPRKLPKHLKELIEQLKQEGL
ncbi:MAG: molecular chaperone DnaJ [Candidatus Sungbacteria bacterium RIFCSPHIGHO2_02_FULL_49_12]|uniref:Chaperone protein DnaJ n=1 Tax=Candidatus Sungbacteria bacterium RIFCSPHIGHO2_02_FULL_49_12 TaxID=1802271 RepID=A0A1G2KRH2_9BACT|nr:MAG: molecular chaperone DnaJ [Candidatus Sungbacteria bacterium RIFCSPHIGHO2_02_FULL_49_12]